MSKKLACCLCGGVIHTDCEHIRLTAEFVPDDQPGQYYYLHRKCLSELNDPEDFTTDDNEDPGMNHGMPVFD